MHRDPGQKHYFDRRLGQTHLLVLDSLLQRQSGGGGCLQITLGTETLMVAVLGSFYHVDTGAGGHHGGILPLVH